MKECFIPKKFAASSIEMIDHANRIIADYLEEGYKLTLRQLYYQFVTENLVPNTMKSYKRLQGIVNDARMAGMIDWDSIEDRTRFVRQKPQWTGVSQILKACEGQFEIDPWQDQKNRLEVWIEKDALIGVIEGTCNKYGLEFMSTRGYMSSSEMYEMIQRIRRTYGIMRSDDPEDEMYFRTHSKPKKTIIIHLGDHDPSGIDMTRYMRDRIIEMLDPNFGDIDDMDEVFEMKRIALNMSEVKKFKLPPNPAKETDSRSGEYKERFGDKSWELDALKPTTINEMLEQTVMSFITDPDMFEKRIKQGREGREELSRIRQEFEEKEN